MVKVLKVGRTTYNVSALLSLTEEDFVKMHKNIIGPKVEDVKQYLKKTVKTQKDDSQEKATNKI